METVSSPSGPDSNRTAIILDHVDFSYSRMPVVVDDVSLEIDAGEMVGLLGPNGAGKSTVLKLVTGVLRPKRGRTLLGGDEVRSLGRMEVARRVAMVPQDFSVQFAYTVQQIVELGRLPRLGTWGIRGPVDQAAVQGALEATGMQPLAHRVFNELSGGERQRALISLALAQDTPIMLLDEPTAHLDIRYQIEVLELLRRLNHERGLTVLAALHDLNLAARYFPRLVLLAQTIVADGPPAQVFDREILSRIYQTQIQVGILRGEEHLSVLPPGYLLGEKAVFPESHAQAQAEARKEQGYVHVLAGGGSGELLMRALADARIAFVAGPLNAGDSDAALAGRLADLCILEPPYAPVSEEGLVSAREHMVHARAVIVCPMPLGQGNIALLAAACEARCAGVPVLLFEPGYLQAGGTPDELLLVEARDYSGQGREAYRRLVEAGARWIGSNAGLLAALTSNHPFL